MNILFSRSPRIRQELPQVVVEIHDPPKKTTPPSFSISSIIAPIIMTVVMVGLYVYMSSSGIMKSNFIIFQIISSCTMGITYLVPFFAYRSQKKDYQSELIKREQKYRENLHQHREKLQKEREKEEDSLRELNPAPLQCMVKVQQNKSALWERSPHDPDFLSLRLGRGKIPSSIQISIPKQEVYEKDPLIEEALQLAKEFEKVSDVPILLPLNQAQVVGVCGDRESILNSMRNLIIQLVTHHSPDEVKLVAFYSEEESNQWNWMRWLPHVWDEQHKRRFLASNPSEAREMIDYLYEMLNRRLKNKKLGAMKPPDLPRFIFLISDPSLLENEAILPLLLKESKNVGGCTLYLADSKEILPMQCHAIVEVDKGKGNVKETNYLYKEEGGILDYSFQSDFISVEAADQIARILAPVRLRANKSNQMPQVLTMFELLSAKSLEDLDVSRRWNQNRFPNMFPVPVGITSAGKQLDLNIHDKIERKGHGPHGLIAGTTGSGKSEVIQSFIAALALNYHPHDIVFLLIDYKGGGMSNTFEQLPHLVGSITNLDGNLIERAKVSLKAELMRREKIFKEAGNLQHIDEYYKSHYREKHPLPHLVIVVDEFAELKKEQPDFMNELISIAAKGRTLGVHLILATQKPAGVVDDKIWSNSRFRICLRVQDEADSREMIKIPNAAWITTPGQGYFQVGSNELLELVQFAWSGAPYRPEKSSVQEVSVKEVFLSGMRITRSSASSLSKPEEDNDKKQLQVIVDYLAEQAENMQIQQLGGPWLPPLPKQIFLEDLLQNEESGNGQKTVKWLEPMVGLYDDPVNQNQESLRIPLHEGHLPVYGMPGTGKTTFVQTMLFSLAQYHSPEEVHMYVLDFGDMFRDFQQLPHMGAVIREDEPDRIKRLFRFLQNEMVRRREQMSASGIKTFEAFRNSISEPMPALIVVVDGYITLKKTFEEDHNDFEKLLRTAGSFGIHFVVTANQITDMYDRIRNNFSLGISFELADPTDYYTAVGRLKTFPVNLPEGRGFVKGNVPPLEFQTALPIQGNDEIERAIALRQYVQSFNESWKGLRPRAIESVPDAMTLEELLAKHVKKSNQVNPKPLQVPVALSIDEVAPFYVSLTDGPYFVVGSPIEGGKTSFLQTWILSLAYFTPPSELEIYIVDSRPSSLGLSIIKDVPHVKGYASDETELKELLQQIQQSLDKRKVPTNTLYAPSEGALEQKEPAIFLVIDDADFLSKRMNDYELKNTLTQIVGEGRNKNFYMTIAGVPSNFPYSSNDWLSDIKGMETGFLFASLDSNDLSFFKIPISESRSLSNPANPKILRAGEGYFAKRRFQRIKGVIPFSDNLPPIQWVKRLRVWWSIRRN